MSSRLFQEIREKRGLAYSVYSFPPTTPTPACSASTPAAPARCRRGAGDLPRASSPRSPRAASPTRSSTAARARPAARWCSAWRTPARGCRRHRQGRAGLRRAARRRRGAGPDRRGHPRRLRAVAADLLRPGPVPGRRRPVRRRLRPRALAGSSRGPERLPHMAEPRPGEPLRVGVLGCARPDGREVVPGRRGRRRPGAGRGGRRGRLAVGVADAGARGRRRLHPAGRGDGQHAAGASTRASTWSSAPPASTTSGCDRVRGWLDEAPGRRRARSRRTSPIGAVLMMRFAAQARPVLRVGRDHRAAPPGQGRRAERHRARAPPSWSPRPAPRPASAPVRTRPPPPLDGARGADVDGVPVHSVRLRGPGRAPGGPARQRGRDADPPARLARPRLVHAGRAARRPRGRVTGPG